MAINVGDIFFVAYFGQGAADAANGNPSPEGFAIFFKNAVAPGEVLRFTDGALQSNGTSFGATEGSIAFTVPAAGLAAGTVVVFPLNGTMATNVYAIQADGTRVSIGTITPGGTALANGGDQLFAYQGSLASATVLAGVDVSNASPITTGATNTNNTYAPPAGVPFLDFPQGTNNLKIAIDPTTATPAQLVAIANYTQNISTTTNPEASMNTIRSAPMAGPDTTAPTLITSAPADNTTAVAIDANIVLTFNEAVKAGTGNIVLRPTSGPDIVIAITDATQVTFNGGQVIVNPTADLQPGVAYDVIVASAVITDLANNAFAGIVQDALDFTTAAPAETISVTTTTLTQNEGDTGTAAFAYTLTRTGSTAAAATVAFAITAAAGATTLDGADFDGGTLPTGTATFAIGSATAIVTINVAGDRAIEATEGFTLTLSAPSAGYVVDAGAGTASGTITNDDVAGTVSVADVSVNEALGIATVTFNRTGGSGDASVNFTTVDGTATAGGDYTSNSGVASFAGGANTAQIFINIASDALAEGNEAFTLALTPGMGGPTLANTSATVTIVDDDFAVNVADVSVNENTGTVTVTLTRNSGNGDVSINYATANGTAIAPGDYVTTTGTATFTGTATTTSFTIPIADDATSENAESFAVNLSVASGNATLVRPSATVTINDNDGIVIPGGSFATTYAANTSTNYVLLAGTTRSVNTAAIVGVTVSANNASIDIQGTLQGFQGATQSNQTGRAIDGSTTAAGDTVLIGANGLVTSANADAIRFRAVNGNATINNQGQVIVTNAAAPPTVGGNAIGNGHAIVLTAVQGAAGAPATDNTSGGVVTNGSTINTAALIRSDVGDAVRLGSHQTLINYGTINGNGPVNDPSTNNVFRPAGSNVTTETYGVSRGVRIDNDNNAVTGPNQGKSIRVDNFGTITGAQHGVDFGDADSADSVVNNAAGAQIIGRNGSGVGADTIGAAATTITVNNSGTIRGDRAATVIDRAGYTYTGGTGDSDGDGVDIDGGATIINNAGATIAGTGAGGFDTSGRSNSSEGISIGGGVITNSGTISGAAHGITVNNDSNANGSRSGVAATTILNNAAGTITGSAGYAIRLENKTGTATDNDAITNYGTITGNATIPTGTVLLQNGAADTGTVGTVDGVAYTAAADAGNARFIRGDGAAIQTGEGADTLANYGAIVGNVSARAINLEGGADALTLFTGSSVTGRIDGGAGVDTLTLRLDDRPMAGGQAGNNSGAVTGTLANVVNIEALSVASGMWTLTDAQSYANGSAIANGATLVLNADLGGAIADDGRLVANSAGAIVLSGPVSGSGVVEKAGSGTLTLAAAGSYTGGTALTAGTLAVATAGAAGTGVVAFATGAQTLRIETAALTAGVFANNIANFATDGDVIDVRGIGLATASYNGATGVLTLTGTSTASLTIGTGYAGLVFTTASDGAGGTNVTVAPPPPMLSIAAASVTEGMNGTAALLFTVTASAAAPAGGISFTAATTDGTATTGDGDYTAISQVFTIAAGQTSTTVSVAITGDTRIEPTETLSVTLSAPTNATIGTGTATGTITNDDVPALSISDPSVVEGNVGGTAVLRYTVTASAPAPTGGISFTIATADGTATAGTDYAARTATGTIAAGQTTYTFDVQVIGDVAPERAETVLVNLSAATGATIADAQGNGFIDNDDGAPAGLQPVFSANFNGFTAAGFAPNPTAAQLDSDVWRVVGLSDNANPVFGGTYTTGDFARGTIAAGSNPAAAGVYSPVSNPALILQPTGAEIDNGGFIEAQIVNTTGFTATSFEVGFDWAYRNSGDRASNLAFSYSTDGATFVTVPAASFSTPGTTTDLTGPNFVLQNQLLTIDGVLVGDGNAIFLRWTHVNSTPPNNRDEVGIDNVVVRAGVSDIQTLSAGDIQVVEGTGGQSLATFTITRSSGTGTASIAFATADGTALAGRDYTAQSGTLTFAEGERSKTVSVAIATDAANEAAETFFLNLTSPMGVSVTDAQARAVILNDDAGPVGIFDIQGAGHASAFAGQSITTGGIVTAISANSFWLQDLAGDGLFATSDAIQVFFGAAPTGVVVGNLVTVTGTVTEFVPTAGALSVTELTAPTFTVTGSGALPTAVLIGANGGILPPTNIIDDDRLQVFDPLNDGIDFYEALEGMLVTVQAPIVTAPSDGRTTYIVASGGVGATNVNERGGITLTGDDGAPERIQLFADSTLLPGYTPDHTTGDILGDITGILTYFSFPELLPTQPITTIRDTTPTQEQTTLVGDADRLTVATFNIENADPGDPQAKFDAIATEVISGLGRPDIVGLQEVQDADGAGAGTNLSGMATAQKIIDAILAQGGPAYTYIEVAPTTANTTGGEPGGNIRNGYLYNAARVGYVDGSAVALQDAIYNGTRRPLVAQFVFNEATVTVINAHSTSRGGSDLSFGANQPPAQAGDAARTAQAAAIKTYIDNLQAADPNARVVALGDFNGYYYEPSLRQFTDGGTMTNLFTLLPVAERYTYLFEGASQAFDNIIVTNNLLPNTQFDVVHYNAEQTLQPVTDHDQSVASLFIARRNTAPTDLAIDTAVVAENAPAGTLVGTLSTTDAEGGVLTYALTDDAGGRFAIDATTGRLTTTAALDFEATPSASVTVRVTDAGGLTYDEAFAIAVTNVNEAPRAPTTDAAVVAENATAGTLVATAAATDPDGTVPTFSLVDESGGLFAIDATTGRITTTAPLDFETRQTAAITVRASDVGGLFADSVVSVAITNVNEAPTTLALSNASIAENAPAGTVVGTLAGTDPDAGGTLSYSLIDNGAGRFAVNATTGQVTTTQALDFETVRAIAITGRVTDNGGLTLDRTFSVAVTNVNEAPTGLALNGTTVAENAPAGTTVGTASAIDPDGDTLRYSFVSNPGELFAIDAATGRLTVVQPLNYEAATSRPVTIRATDIGGLFVDRAVTIAVGDVNEAPTGVTISAASVTENAAGGTVIGALSGNDPDAGDALTYRLGGTDARFVINGSQLAVAAGAVIDFETEQSIALAITATDRAGLTATSTVTLAVQDVAEAFQGTPGNDTINGDAGANTINGGAGDDTINGRGGADIIDGGDGNDTINGGAGADRIMLGAGADTVRALLSELLGDTITDFTAADRIVVQNSDIKRGDFQVNATGLQFAGGTLALPGARTGGDFMAAHVGIDTVLTFNSFLPMVEDKKSVDAGAINGIVNQPYLAGDNSSSFTVNVESIARAKFANTLGVYEINIATGAISDVRIIAANVKNAGSITVTGIDPGNQLGFFIVQDGANKLSSGVLSSTGLSLISTGGTLALANNGTAVSGVTTFFSHSAAANVDGAVHVVSGVTADGSGALRIGFEDLTRSGSGSDNDFQDVVITVAAVSQPRPTTEVTQPFAIADVTHAPIVADMAMLPMSASDVAVLHG